MSILSLNSRAEQIVFEVSTDKSAIRVTDLSQSIDEQLEELTPEQKYMTKLKIDMFAADMDGENVMDIGFAECIYFESEVVFSGETSLIELCDTVTSDVSELAELITGDDGGIDPAICPPDFNILYIQKIYIEENCRGFGAGEYLLNNLNPLLMRSLNISPHVYIVLPYPQTKTEDAAKEEAVGSLPRLIRFYEKAGFSKIGDSEYMHRKQRDDLLSFLYGE